MTALTPTALNLIARALYASSKPTRLTQWHMAFGTSFSGTDIGGQIGSRINTGEWSVAGREASSPAFDAPGVEAATHWAVYSASSGGTCIGGGELSSSGGVAAAAGAFKIRLNGGGAAGANIALTWLMTDDSVTLPSAWHVTAGTGGSEAGITGEAGARASASPSVSGAVATFGAGYSVSIAADAGTVSTVGVYDASSGGNLLGFLTQAGVATGEAGSISVATGGTITAS